MRPIPQTLRFVHNTGDSVEGMEANVRALNISVVIAASLSLAACSGIRTVNGVDVESSRELCSGRSTASCVVLGSAIVVAAGIGVGLAVGLANGGNSDQNRKLAAFAAAASTRGQATATSGPVVVAAPAAELAETAVATTPTGPVGF